MAAGFLIFSYPKSGFAVDAAEAERAAQNFIAYIQSERTIRAAEILEANRLDPEQPEMAVAYLFHLDEGGYILVSASRNLSPIKAYSLSGDFDDLPPPVREFLLREVEYNMRVTEKSSGISTQTLSPTQQSWDFLLNPSADRSTQTYTPHTELLTSAWNQGYPYNRYLPEVEGSRVLAGCVNVALGQLMRYHGHPATGTGVAAYDWNGQTLKSVFHRPFNWANMPDVLSWKTPEHQVDEVALLLRDLGIANQTAFGPNESGANINIAALIENLGYAADVQYLGNSDPDLFFSTLRSELDALRPALLTFRGDETTPSHMAVADGYRTDLTGNWIHVNFGWGGHEDGYYCLDEAVTTIPSSLTFTPQLYIHANIRPCSGGNCSASMETGDSLSEDMVIGRFDYLWDADLYPVYLKGHTLIAGGGGHAEIPQAFFVSIYDGDHLPIFSSDDLIEDTFQEGLYYLLVSKCMNTACWGSSAGWEDYWVSVSTEELTPEEKAAVDAAAQKPPVFGPPIGGLSIQSLQSETGKILVDARDENGDAVRLKASSTNPAAVQASIEGNLLVLEPTAGSEGQMATVTVRAEAAGDSVETSFVVPTSFSFGSSYVLRGKFSGYGDSESYDVVLDGPCEISGFNGFANQAFFTVVYDQGVPATLLAGPTHQYDVIRQDFPLGLYRLTASLCAAGIGCYPYMDGQNDHYTVSVSCPDASENPSVLSTLSRIDVSGLSAFVGDVDGDRDVDLADAILALQLLSGRILGKTLVNATADVNGDGRLGWAEVLFALEKEAGQR